MKKKKKDIQLEDLLYNNIEQPSIFLCEYYAREQALNLLEKQEDCENINISNYSSI